VTILFAGTPETAAESLISLVRQGAPISLVLTRLDAPVGRKRVSTPSPVAQAALALGLPVIKTNSISTQVIEAIHEAKISFGLVIAYGVILREPALSTLPKGWFNVHFSLLPKWRGAAPVQRSLIAGDAVTGVTVFKIDAGLDTGDIVASLPAQIEPSENAKDLLRRLGGLGVSLLLEVIPQIQSGLLKLSPQSKDEVSIASKISRAEAELNFKHSAATLENLVRGSNPEPGAWTTVQGVGDLKVFEARSHPSFALERGQCSLVSGMVMVGCGQGSLELLEVQPAGKTRMSASAWLRGLPTKVVLGSDV
jgi:methionyl-tRNA formyltransferase